MGTDLCDRSVWAQVRNDRCGFCPAVLDSIIDTLRVGKNNAKGPSFFEVIPCQIKTEVPKRT
jgi:hypothetical protein